MALSQVSPESMELWVLQPPSLLCLWPPSGEPSLPGAHKPFWWHTLHSRPEDLAVPLPLLIHSAFNFHPPSTVYVGEVTGLPSAVLVLPSPCPLSSAGHSQAGLLFCSDIVLYLRVSCLLLSAAPLPLGLAVLRAQTQTSSHSDLCPCEFSSVHAPDSSLMCIFSPDLSPERPTWIFYFISQLACTSDMLNSHAPNSS